jgi:ribosomal protein S6--L-glutamate ligase
MNIGILSRLMEVNSSPGLEGIEEASGVDVAGAVIEFIEKNGRPGGTRDRIGA